MSFAAASDANCSIPLSSSSAVNAGVLGCLGRSSRAESYTYSIIKDFVSTAVLAFRSCEENVAKGQIFKEFLVGTKHEVEGEAVPSAVE